MRKVLTVGIGGVVALVVAAGAFSETKDSYSFKATLTGAQEVPKSTAPAGAGGTFAAKSVESGKKVTFTWKLTFHGLSGKAIAAHVHLGKKGVAGAVAIALCGPCKSGQTGKAIIASSVETALETGKTYVNVHTPKNPGGEIRGQVKLVAG
jgi:hypothetical protein